MTSTTDRASYLTADHRDKTRHFGRHTLCPSCHYPRYRRPWTDGLLCLNQDCPEYSPRPVNPARWRSA